MMSPIRPETRPLASASPKHERLFSLLDRREFDQIEIVILRGDPPHAKVAAYAAEFICQNHPNASVTRFENDDLLGLVEYLDAKHLENLRYGGANFELSLTGARNAGACFRHTEFGSKGSQTSHRVRRDRREAVLRAASV